jgi:hypothetical protein
MAYRGRTLLKAPHRAESDVVTLLLFKRHVLTEDDLDIFLQAAYQAVQLKSKKEMSRMEALLSAIGPA